MIFLYNPTDEWEVFLHLPNVQLYDESLVTPEDTVVISVYWHLYSIMSVLQGKFEDALLNTDFQKKNCGILDNNMKELLKKENTVLVLYNSWETRDVNFVEGNLKIFVEDHLHLNVDNVFFSTSCYANHMRKREGNVIGFDWPFLLQTKNFDSENIISKNSEKKYRILCLNRRGSYQRYLYCNYIFRFYPEKTAFSYLGTIGPLLEKHKEQYKLTLGDAVLFNKGLPRKLDSCDPEWENEKPLTKYFEKTYIFFTFETNWEPFWSKTQQISEKSYKGIKFGLPFIIFSTTGGILKHLHNLGFKTFSPFINEDYDDSSLTYEERYALLIKETDRICNLSEEEMQKIYLKMDPINE